MKSAVTILFCLLLINHIVFSQDASINKESQVEISFSSFGKTDLIRFQSLDGSASHNGEKFFSLGANYLKSLNAFLWFKSE